MLFCNHFQIRIRAESREKIVVHFFNVRVWIHRVTPALFNDVSSTAVTRTYEECTIKFAEGSSSKENSWNPNHRGVTIPDARSSRPKKFCTLAPDIYVNSVWKFLLVTQLALRILR